MPTTRSGGVSRNVQHGNTVDKSGKSVAQFQKKAVVKAQRPMKVTKKAASEAATEPKKKFVNHSVIAAKGSVSPERIE